MYLETIQTAKDGLLEAHAKHGENCYVFEFLGYNVKFSI
jgi:hypothetical protein